MKKSENQEKKSNISVEISLDENHVPDRLEWSAPDGGINHQPTKAVMLSFWDETKKEALRIDLWTKDMPVDDMKIFFHQVFISMSNSYENATSDKNTAKLIREFAETYAKASEIID
ncbi:gliding motility protein GldC [Candidatus Ornithobacterium hominis]|uniref:gliding motility protein GldC n=1 Tax=Candidatus Ornithobacterium hominis TaxID=2497989 RepID=UPI000E5C3A20|nr:gliding motility protein GldC [Candidatus Ornithobacterium hominis]